MFSLMVVMRFYKIDYSYFNLPGISQANSFIGPYWLTIKTNSSFNPSTKTLFSLYGIKL